MSRRPADALVVAHGGAAARHYRNVLEALGTALACGADMFEFDVRRTGDGALVVHHDPDIEGVLLSAMTADEAVARAAGLGYPLPRVADVLRRARGRLRLDVELKEAGDEVAVLRLLRDDGWTTERFVVTSFEPRALAAVRDEQPEVRTGLLVWDVPGMAALDAFASSAAAFLAPDHQMLDAAVLSRAARAGIALLPWTVNDPGRMRELIASPAVAGIITDDPVSALRVRDGGGPWP